MADLVPTGDYGYYDNVINGTWNLANLKAAEMTGKFNSLNSNALDIEQAPTIAAGSASAPSVAAPNVAIPQEIEIADVVLEIGSSAGNIANDLVARMATFITTHFPNNASAYSDAEEYLKNAINNPDAGIPTAVQEQLLEDDKSRILEDASRASDAVIGSFAARGYPMPPGAAVAATVEIQRKAHGEIASSSRKLSALAIEMQKFNIEKLISVRGMAMSSALDYIKSLSMSHDTATKYVSQGYDAQSRLISSAADFYRADIAAAELAARNSQFNVATTLDAAAKNQAAELSVISEKTKAMISEATSIASMATSLFNNLNVSLSLNSSNSASRSYSESHNYSYEGS